MVEKSLSIAAGMSGRSGHRDEKPLDVSEVACTYMANGKDRKTKQPGGQQTNENRKQISTQLDAAQHLF